MIPNQSDSSLRPLEQYPPKAMEDRKCSEGVSVCAKSKFVSIFCNSQSPSL